MTLEELKKLYAEKGATEQRTTTTEQGDQIDYVPIEYGGGYGAFENVNEETGAKTLGGFSKKDGDYIDFFDPSGKMLGREKWNQSGFEMMKRDLGPIAMAALSGYLGGVPLGETGLTAGNALSAAKSIQNKDVLGLLSSGSGAFDTAGVDLGGISAKDIMKYANLAKGASDGGAGAFNALVGLSQDDGFNNLAKSFGGFDVNPNDFTEGYFLPGGEGYIDPMSKTEGVTGSGYYDEITGRYIKDDLGGLTNPLGRKTGNLDPNSKWEYSLTRPGVWVNDKGEEIDLSYLPNTEKVMTGREIMEKAGALPKATDGTKTAAKTTPNKLDLNALGSAFGVTGIPSEDSLADIKLMQQIFGQDIDYKLASIGGSKRK
jgi:hypothetical protein